MADVDFDHYEGSSLRGAGPGAGMGRAVNLIGAACSLALIAGLGVWGYKLALRDVTGIPVFRAVEGPLRVAPKDPGGSVTMHQGLSVNAVAAAGTALPLPETLKLAPRAVDLAAEDAAGLADLPMEAGRTPALDPLAETALLAPAAGASAAPAEGGNDAVAAALAEALADDAAPLAEAVAGTAAETVAETAAEPVAAPDLAAPVVELAAAAPARPRARPAMLRAATAETVAAPASIEASAATGTAAELAPETLAAGTPLVQLGAFDDEAAARGEWARLGEKFGDLMTGKALVVQAAQSGGRTFYRLRAAGFASTDESRQFCTALLSGNATCIPVAQR